MQSMFGGDHRYSHFTLMVKYGSHTKERDLEKAHKWAEARVERDRRKDVYKTRRAKLKTLGYKQQFFQFRNERVEEKAAAKKKAEAHRLLWKKKSGYDFDVSEGFFL